MHAKSTSPLRLPAYWLAVAFTAAVLGLASTTMNLGYAGMVAGVLIGALWAMLLGYVIAWALRRPPWRMPLANVGVLLAIVASGLLVGGGKMYAMLISTAMNEPGTSDAVLAALMQPGIPYFIAVNSPMELLIVPLLLIANWDAPTSRRRLIFTAVVIYFLMRVWTYTVFAAPRVDMLDAPLTAEGLSWYERTAQSDQRGKMNVIMHLCLILAAFVPMPRYARTTCSTASSAESDLCVAN